MGANRVVAIAALAALAGCASLAPEYARPPAPVPGSWPETPAGPAAQAAPDLPDAEALPWREFYADGRLRQVIELALENNRDLRSALLAVERSRARFRIQGAALLPQVDAAAAGTIRRVPADLASGGEATTTHQYGLEVGITSYELDLFGRVRSLRDQALEQYLSTEEARRSVRISLVSQVAAAYLALGADRERLALARETLVTREASHELIGRRHDAGVASALDLQQSRTAVETARVDVARYASLASQDANALALAVGAPVPVELLPEALPPEAALRDISPGLPSAVLLRRPDILEAERQLRRANAAIGTARAAFFPRIALTTSAGLGSDELSGLFSGDAGTWSFAPRISLPIFTAGANRANLEVARIDRELAVAAYEKAIQAAFREVADALAQRATIGGQLAAQRALAEAAAESHRLSRARYDKGIDSYLAVLDSQRALYAAQLGLIATGQARLGNLATLYKALGGGPGE